MSRDSARQHVADPPISGGGREMLSSRDRGYSTPGHKLGRFRWAVVALFMLALCSLAAAVILTATKHHSSTNSATASGAAWSSWRPPDNGLAGAQDIADYIAPYYRATPASQLAVVTVVNLNNPTAPVQVVVPTGSAGAIPLPAGNTIVYNLCGEGSSNCSIGVGKPSTDRLLLLRREALELALYTFKYIGGTQTVIAILPPGHTTEGCTGICSPKLQAHAAAVKPLNLALAFDRSELAPWLDHPLRQTLPEELPPTVSQMSNAPEAELVSVITAHGLFSEHVEQAQDGSSVIVLSQLPPQ